MIRALLLFFAALLPAAASWPNGYTFRRSIVINHQKVAGDLAAFPVLITGTYPDLATVANNGAVSSPNGYDLIFTSDPAGSNLLPFERMAWSSATGAIMIMVGIPALSSSTDTTIYLFYGNSSVTADRQDKTGVWDSNYKGVFHLSENTSSRVVSDSTSNAHAGTNVANTSAKSTTGPFQTGTQGSALTFNGSSDWTDLGVNADWDITSGDGTWELWIRPSGLTTYTNFITHGAYGADGYYFQWADQATYPGQTLAANGGPASTINSSVSFAAGAWSHTVFVKSGATGTWYLNGSSIATGSFGAVITSARHLWLGRDDSAANNAAAALAEFRLSNIARSSAWIATTYRNQNNPSTFFAAGAPQAHSNVPTMSSFVVF